MSETQWERAAGAVCSVCGREVWRARDSMCMLCWDTAHEFEVRGDPALLEFLPQTVIMEIARPSGRG